MSYKILKIIKDGIEIAENGMFKSLKKFLKKQEMQWEI